MKTSLKITALAAITLALLVAASPAQGAGRNLNPGIIPPGSTYRGQSYGEWGAQWWKTLFSIPVVDGDHPFFSGGAFEGEKRVVFLAATGGGVTIDVTIPPGTSLFFPVLNFECSVLEPDPSHGDNEAEMRACANGHIDHTSGLIAVIDGVPVQDLAAYRVESPLFEFGPLPADNVLGAPAGTTSPRRRCRGLSDAGTAPPRKPHDPCGRHIRRVQLHHRHHIQHHRGVTEARADFVKFRLRQIGSELVVDDYTEGPGVLTPESSAYQARDSPNSNWLC